MKLLIILSLITILNAQSNDQIVYSGILQTLDFVTTSYGLQNGMQELNPIMKPIISNSASFIVIKVIVFYSSTKLNNKQLRWLNTFYTILIINNLNQLRRI